MHFSSTEASILAVLVASVVLVLEGGDRLFPIIALVASGVEALLAFGVMTLALAKFRIDIILPALLVIGGGVCWARRATKPAITSATIITLIGLLQLLHALSLLH